MKLSSDDFKANYHHDKPATNQEVIFHCKLGGRAQKAADQAVALGFNKYISRDISRHDQHLMILCFSVKNYKGSWTEWAQKEKL